MLKQLQDKAENLLSFPGKILKWGSRSSREKATIALISAILGFIVFIIVLCLFPTLVFSAIWLGLVSAALYMVWHMLEDTFR